ncbi:MAG: type IV secretion system DNA-binding domain-containing protein [Anaerolineaceae bacterium]|nr:type IV secretion system DNA-binding domain-containing protein [Anaerolineaceae bacterium]
MIEFGSRGPFIGNTDFGISKFSIQLQKLNTHMYVVGRSGKGKSKFLEGFLWQLINHGQGCGLIDPHGDLASNLLKLLAFQSGSDKQPWLAKQENVSKLIYCEPGHKDYFVPMNVLASKDAPYTIVSNVIEAFQRTWSQELAAAPQFKNIALHGLLLLIEHRLSLVELPRLFMFKEFRDALLDKSQNEDVKAFFYERFERWGREQSLRIESLLNKVTALTLNPSLKLMLGASENRLNLRQFMDEGKILIFNLGTCDHETRNLLGSLLAVRLEQAALSRVELEEDKRRRWYCVLDEFQRFVANEGSAQALAEMLSEARKFGLFLCLAHQGWHQLANARLEGALDQAQIKVIFGSGTKTGRIVAEELFVPDPQKTKHEGASKNANPVYENLLEQKEMFVQTIRRQRHREIFLLPPESDKVVALKTLNVPQPKVDKQQFEHLKTRLLQTVGLPVQSNVYMQSQQSSNGQHRLSVPRAGKVIQYPSVNWRQRQVFQAERSV